MRLSQFQYEFQYSKGENNVNSDCLSRLPLPDTIRTCEPYELIFTLEMFRCFTLEIETLNKSIVCCSDVRNETDIDSDYSTLKHYVRYGFPNVIDNPKISKY